MPRHKTVSDRIVIDQALEVLAERGLEGFTFAAVAAEAGLAPATLVQRFGSKEGMLERALERAHERLEEEMRRPFGRSRPREGLITWLVALAHPLRTRALMAGHLQLLQKDLRDNRLRARARRQSEMMQERIGQHLAAWSETSPDETLPDAQTVEAHWHGLIIQWGLAGDGSLDDWLRDGLGALLPRPSSDG